MTTCRSSRLLFQKAASTISTAAARRQGGRARKESPGRKMDTAYSPPAQPPAESAAGPEAPRQPGGGQEQQVVHHCVEQKQGIHIDDGHGYTPPSTAAALSIIGSLDQRNRSKQLGTKGFTAGLSASGQVEKSTFPLRVGRKHGILGVSWMRMDSFRLHL